MAAKKQPKQAPKPRANQAEKLLRVSKVRDWLLAGKMNADIVQLSAKEWGVKSRQTQSYIKAARKQIRDFVLDERDVAIKRHAMIRQLILSKALDASNLYVALDAAKDEARLLNLYEDNRMVIQLDDNTLAMMKLLGLTPEMLLSAIKRQVERKATEQGVPVH